ncbi:MAG: TonB-dependent receptor domain-containing protein, partial [Prevotella sp.]
MKRLLTIVFCLSACFRIVAQTTTEVEICQHADASYRIGRFDEAIRLLTDNISNLSARTRSTAYHLLSLCYMEKDESEEAAKYASLLLNENPYYSPTLSDPLRFIDLIEKLKSGKTATITTASQQAESLDEAPVPVTLITEDMIKDSGAKTLSDLLVLYVPGMTKVEGLESNVAMHGVYSSTQEKILIMLNGHRLNSRTTNSEQPDFRTSLEKIKQIEVLRGPASSLYGNVALTAVVNIITKSGGDVDGLKVSTGIGNNNTYQADILLGKSSYGIDLMGWASVYSSQGERRDVQPGDKEFYGRILTPGYMYLDGYNHKPSYDIGVIAKWNDFKFFYNTQSSKKVIPYSNLVHYALYSYDKYRKVFGATPGHTRDNHHIELSYEKLWQKWALKFQTYVDIESCSNNDVCGDSILEDSRYLPSFPGEVISSDIVAGGNVCDYGLYQVQSWNDYTYGGLLQSTYSFQKNAYEGSWLFGAQFENYTMKDNTMLCGDHFDRVVITQSDANKSIRTESETYLSAFSQLKMSYKKRFIFNGGLRFDYKQRYNSTLRELSPRLSLIYKISNQSSLKLGYAHSFVDAPYFYRATLIHTYSGGDKLEAEKMDAVQLNYTHNFKSLSLHYDCNVYYNLLTNNIFFDPTQFLYTNSGSLKVWG